MRTRSFARLSLAALLPLAALSPLAGCQRYRPEPLDLAGHDATFRSRDPAAGEVRAYARRLASLGREAAGAFDPADGLSESEAEVVALFFNPQLRAARLKARVPLAGARFAARWDDPALAIDAERILRSVPEPWVLGGTLAFTLPLSGRLGAERRLAHARADVEALRACGEEAQVLVELRARWLEWSAKGQQVELTRRYLGELDEILRSAEQLRDAGELDRLDARLFRIERVTRAGELRVLELELREAELAIKGLMGLAPHAAVSLVPALPVAPARGGAPASRPGRPDELHPLLRVARAEYEAAERALALEVRKQYPDLTLGAGPGTEDGDARALLGLSLPLPLLNANRRGIAEALAARDAARAAAEAAHEQLVRDLAQAEAALEASRERRSSLEGELAPLVDEQVAEARRLGRLGDFNTLLTLEAYTRAHETKLQVLEATLREAAAANRVRALRGPFGAPAPSPAEEVP